MEKIKWYVVLISLCVGIAGVVLCLDSYRLRNEIYNLNKQIEQKDILIEFLKEED